jgi:hypothetical protein
MSLEAEQGPPGTQKTNANDMRFDKNLHSDFEQRYGRTVLTIRAMTGGAGYSQRHLEHNDYYDEHRKVQGEWQGRGAELLGLRSNVTREQFQAVREGLHPETGEFLRPRRGADRVNDDESEQSKARSLYDLTFSAPKSVSIQAMVGGDERLVAAHDNAVREALGEAEKYAATLVRLNRANEDRTTANWIVAAYRHDTSHELDPQLHTHAVAANLTDDGVWRVAGRRLRRRACTSGAGTSGRFIEMPWHKRCAVSAPKLTRAVISEAGIVDLKSAAWRMSC